MAQSQCDSSQHHVVLVLLRHVCPRRSCRWPELMTATLHPEGRPRPWVTLSRYVCTSALYLSVCSLICDKSHALNEKCQLLHCAYKLLVSFLTKLSSSSAYNAVWFVQATFYALQQTYAFLSPELWKSTQYTKAPLQEFTDFLAKPTIDAPKPVDNTPTY